MSTKIFIDITINVYYNLECCLISHPDLDPRWLERRYISTPQAARRKLRPSERRISNPMKTTDHSNAPSQALASSESVADGNGLTHRLIGLPEDVTIDSWEEHDHTIECFVSWNEPKGDARICPECGSTRCVKKDKGTTQTVRHTPVGFSGTLITFHKPRFKCKDCGKTFYMRPDWVIDNMSITRAVWFDIYSGLTSTSHNITQIGIDTKTSASIVQNVMHKIVPGKPKDLPETLGIDEFHGKTGTYNKDTKHYDTETYHCVLTDIDRAWVIDILYSAKYGFLHDYFMEYPPYIRQHVKYVCCDMRSGFSKVARNCFPHAKICIDMFHVVKLLTEAINTIRIDNWKRLKSMAVKKYGESGGYKSVGDTEMAEAMLREARKLDDQYMLIKGSQKILITSPYNDTAYWNQDWDKRDEKLESIYSLVPDLKVAREALVDFYDIMTLPKFGERRSALTSWLEKYMASEVPPVRQAAYSINLHRKGIENSWRYHKSNGPTEGLNKKIKDVKRLGFGAHDFQNFRARALLACGSVTVYKSTYTIFGEKAGSSDEAGDAGDVPAVV